MCRKISFHTGQCTAFLDNVAHSSGSQRLCHMASFANAPEDRTFGDACRVQPCSQGDGCASGDGLVILGGIGAALVGLAMAQGVDELASCHGAQEAHIGSGHFGAAPPTAGPGKQQQRPVAQAAQAIVTAGQQRLQYVSRQRLFFLGQITASCIGLART